MLSAHGSIAFLQSPLKACLLQSALTSLFSPFRSRKLTKAHCHKMLSNISIKLSGLPYLQGSGIRRTQQLRLSLDLLKGPLFFSLQHFMQMNCTWVECVLFWTSLSFWKLSWCPFIHPQWVVPPSLEIYSYGHMLFPQNSLKLDLLQANSYKLSSVLAELEQRPQPNHPCSNSIFKWKEKVNI